MLVVVLFNNIKYKSDYIKNTVLNINYAYYTLSYDLDKVILIIYIMIRRKKLSILELDNNISKGN